MVILTVADALGAILDEDRGGGSPKRAPYEGPAAAQAVHNTVCPVWRR